jgi:prepilin signal peptidase PulO-like enzyme (type II secretory pathway)
MLQAISSWPLWYGLAVLAFLALVAALAVYDARTRRIPNRIVYPGIAAAAALALVNPIGPWYAFAAAGLLAGALLGAIAVLTDGGMGMGDAKLAVLIGLLAGWPNVLVALFVAFATGAAAGLGLIAVRRLDRSGGVPFAPALLVGSLAAFVAGPQLLALAFGEGRL